MSKRIPPHKIQVPVPLVGQCDNVSCGPACLVSVLSYYHVPHDGLDRARKILGTSDEGTTPARIVKAAAASGLKSSESTGWELLATNLMIGIPSICLLQAHGCGHYVVAVGADNRSIYVMDPLIDGHYGYLSIPQFWTRWHDGNYENWSLQIWRTTPLYTLIVKEVP